jgi:RNA polymerase sigma-70 factor (ECF subfamily)
MEYRINLEALKSLDTSNLAYSDIEKIIQNTLDALPEQCRKVFSMSRFEDKMNKEISELLNISVKAVESHITKALKIFRNNLKEYLQLILILFALK